MEPQRVGTENGIRGKLGRSKREILNSLRASTHSELDGGAGSIFVNSFVERFFDEVVSGDESTLDEWLSQLGALDALADYNALIDLVVTTMITVARPSDPSGELVNLLMRRRDTWRTRLQRLATGPNGAGSNEGAIAEALVQLV